MYSTIGQSVLFSNMFFTQLLQFDCSHSNIASCQIMTKIEHQTFIYYHAYLLRNIEFVEYVANHFDTHRLTFARQKSIIWIKLDMKMKFWHIQNIQNSKNDCFALLWRCLHYVIINRKYWHVRGLKYAVDFVS